MATYIIVSKGTDPLGPNEINANRTITVSDGDVFVVDPSADGNITFATGGGTAAFDIEFNGSNTNAFDITVASDLTPAITIGDDADLSGINLDAKDADGVAFTAGNTVSFGQYDGATDGPNTITLGNGFTAVKDWTLGNSNDSLTVGDDATFQNLDAGAGDDTLTFGDRATVTDIDTKAGNDSVTFGDDLDGQNIKTSNGDDTIRFGENAVVNEVDGSEDDDTFYTDTEGLNESNIETSLIVCHGPETLIDTPSGPRRVGLLRPGDLVGTLDGGPCPVRWVRASHLSFDGVANDKRPVLIGAGALGPGRPDKDLVVSPQHRILVGGGGQLEHLFDEEWLVPAKALTTLHGVRPMRGLRAITWVHFALDRHHVVRANGVQSESLYLGPMVVTGLPADARRELQAIFGPFPQYGTAANGVPARPLLSVGAAPVARQPVAGDTSRRREAPGGARALTRRTAGCGPMDGGRLEGGRSLKRKQGSKGRNRACHVLAGLSCPGRFAEADPGSDAVVIPIRSHRRRRGPPRLATRGQTGHVIAQGKEERPWPCPPRPNCATGPSPRRCFSSCSGFWAM